MLATLGAQARCGAAAASPIADKNVRRFMSYPLFAICDDRGSVAENLGHTLQHYGGVILDPDYCGNVGHLRQDCQEKDIVCGEQLQTAALAGEITIQETP
jgi:hypothetical protein